MNENKYAVITGVVVFVCVIGAIIGSMWLNGSGIFRNEYFIDIKFKDTKGLNKGNIVKVEGTSVGRVDNLKLKEDGGAIVIVAVSKDVKLPDDSKFAIETSIMERWIQITRGKSSKMLKDGDQVTGLSRDIFDTFYQLSEKGGKAITSLFTPENLALFALTLREISASAGELRLMIEENRKSLNVISKNLEETSSNVNNIFKDNQDGVKKIVAQMNESSKNFNKLILHSDTLLSGVTRITKKLEKGEGTIGKLFAQDTIYNELKQTSASLKVLTNNLNKAVMRSDTLIMHADTLITDIKKNPKRYLKVGVF